MSFNLSSHKNELLFVPLGGSSEIGMNLNLYHLDGKWLMIDLGIGFAEPHLPGVDIVVPDIEFIARHKKDLLGLVLTHAHEDHLGAVPYLWEELGCPVYATPFTAAFLKQKLAGNGMANQVPIKEVQVGSKFDLGPFALEMVPLTHSVPEMQAIAIKTRHGTVLHTGDWKFDPDPLVGPVSDEATLRRYGDEGVLAMVCDSTNIFVEGDSGSEGDVRRHLVELIKTCQHRVAVTTFASNIARIETILLAAQEAGRVVAMAGRSLWRIVAAAQESGYLPRDIEILTEKQAMDVPRQDILIICTGCQGEPLAALSKLARGEHPAIRLTPKDSVIFASRKIPGNEKRIAWLHNSFIERGIEVLTDTEHFIHVSGHPARAELKRMYELVRPRIAVPTHGETRHIHEHAKQARVWGAGHSIEAKNGVVIQLSSNDPGVIGHVESGYFAVDGESLISTNSPVIKVRRRLRDEGCLMVALAVDSAGRLAAPPRIIAPGVMDPNDDRELIEACEEEVAEALQGLQTGAGEKRIVESVRQTLRRILKREFGKKPMIEVQILEV